MIETCQCKGCERPSLYLGLCNRHYRRNRKYGSPFVTKNHVLKGLPAPERFKRSHKKVASGCWEWFGSVDQDGYGIFHGVHGETKYFRAHRWSWAFHTNSAIDKGMFVCHSCDNPRCVNPEHLWLGSVQENVSDMMAKGRHARLRGQQSARAILTEEQVRKILADPKPYAQIAAEFGVAQSTITSIKNRVSWAHIEAAEIPRAARGSGSGRRGKSDRITPEIVREIRTSTEQGKALATRFGISEQYVSLIRSGQRWAHVT